MKLKGKNVVLTGASRGLGRHFARAFAEAGARLVLVARSEPELLALRDELRASGHRAEVVVADVARPEAPAFVVGEAEQRLGPVDVLVNNAGIEDTREFHELSPDDVERVVRVNLLGTLLLTRAVLPGMLERGAGHVLNVASLAGLAGSACNEVYSATKAGLVVFSSCLRASYRERGVSASALCPGLVEEGIWGNLHRATGVPPASLLGVSRVRAVVRGALRAVEKDLPLVVINPKPVRPLLVLNLLFPRFAEWLAERSGTQEMFRRVGRAQAAARRTADPSARRP